MSVQTTADEALASAKEHLDTAIRDLSKICVDKCWGYDEYNDNYENAIYDSLTELIKLRRKLDP